MKFLAIFLFILHITVLCFAQQEIPALGKPNVYGFTIDITLQQTKGICLKYKYATWIKKYNKIEKNLGDFYQCSAKTNDEKYFFHANIFVKNGRVAYIRFLINQGDLCNRVEASLKNTQICEKYDIYWQYCDELWKVNCYEAQEGEIKINILDIMSNITYYKELFLYERTLKMRINNDEELERASYLLDKFWDVKPWQPGYEEREELVEAIISYEKEHVHIPPPDPITAIKYSMEQRRIQPEDLNYLFGSEHVIWDILVGNAPLTDDIIFIIHTKLGIPLRSLLGDEEGVTLSEFVRTAKESLDQFEKAWLKIHKGDTGALIQECSDDWMDQYERWQQRKFINKG